MNGLLWIAQLSLAIVFLSTGFTKLFAYKRLVRKLEGLPRREPIDLPWAQAAAIGVLEILGAVGVIVPAAFTPAALAPDYLLVRLAAGGLALLMVAAGIYHLRRKEPAAPAVATFLLALFILAGRWPR